MEQAIIYQRGKDGKLHIAARLPGHKSLIRSVSWAPSIGRWYQLIATGCKDGKIRIFKITEKLLGALTSEESSNNSNLFDNGTDVDMDGQVRPSSNNEEKGELQSS